VCVLFQHIKQNIAIHKHVARFQPSPLVSAIISSVVIRTVARPRRVSTSRLPLLASPVTVRKITVLPSTTNSTSLWGNIPSRWRTSRGIVTCPLLVTRIISALLF
jgi:hypothetical protein